MLRLCIENGIQKDRVSPIVIVLPGAEFLQTEYSGLTGVITRKGDSMQQTAMLVLAHILRNVLSIPA